MMFRYQVLDGITDGEVDYRQVECFSFDGMVNILLSHLSAARVYNLLQSKNAEGEIPEKTFERSQIESGMEDDMYFYYLHSTLSKVGSFKEWLAEDLDQYTEGELSKIQGFFGKHRYYPDKSILKGFVHDLVSARMGQGVTPVSSSALQPDGAAVEPQEGGNRMDGNRLQLTAGGGGGEGGGGGLGCPV